MVMMEAFWGAEQVAVDQSESDFIENHPYC